MGEQGKQISFRERAMQCAKEFPLSYDDGREETIWVRTLSGVEMQEAQMALHSERQRIRKLYGEGTEARNDLKASIAAYTSVELSAIVVTDEMPSLMSRARREMPQPLEPDWDKYPTEKEADKVRAEHEKILEEHEQRVRDRTIELARDRENRLNETEIAQLRELVLELSIRNATDQQTEGFLDNYRIYGGFYQQDRQTRLFESVDDVSALTPNVKLYLLMYLRQVDTILPFEIKNSPSRSGQQTGPAENTRGSGSSTRSSRASSSRKKSSRGGVKQ